MEQSKLFKQTKWRLARWYAGVFSLILSIFGLAVYEAIVHAHRITFNQELQTVGATIHDSLEPILEQPEKLNLKVFNLLPNVCLVKSNCFKNNHDNRHLIGAIAQGQYYLQFFDLSKNLVAVAGIKSQGLPIKYSQQQWKTLRDKRGIRYRQISLVLHTEDDRIWGYLHIGKSLADFDRYLNNVLIILLLSLLLIIFIIAIASWWLAGKAMQPIYQSYGQIQQFTADAAHELRTPLAAIRATIESSLMLSDLSALESRELLGTINRQNQRLALLVGDLLTLSRMERQTKIDYTSTVILNDIITDVAEEFAALALSNSIKLIDRIETNEIVSVMGEEEQLYRLVTNLTVNAIQYTDRGGQVTLKLKSHNHEAIVEVVDTGIGIEEEEQKLIFDRFYRVNKARSRDRGDSGLGLAIAKAIVVAHQGDIKVKSELGKGSVFTIYLPII